MRVLGSDHVVEFRPNDSAARKALARWEAVVEKSTWRNFSELKKTFNSADYVMPYTIFDVGGNKYRVIAVLQHQVGLVIIRHVLTHAEYHEGRWR